MPVPGKKLSVLLRELRDVGNEISYAAIRAAHVVAHSKNPRLQVGVVEHISDNVTQIKKAKENLQETLMRELGLQPDSPRSPTTRSSSPSTDESLGTRTPSSSHNNPKKR